ncbi:MAG TPA: prepilin-type N-terminal cleavage/methylation domain-containing protein [Thermoguttaceae bacterium]|nr:prepilin-type N-terminal cleavage/methylation domain-containing protein [Thermoguttaceae bacterium]
MRSSIRRRRRGFSLAEVVISVLLVGLVLIGALELLGASLRTRIRLARRSQGSALARDLMSEILQARYEEPDGSPTFGTEAGETVPGDRSVWDDVDDYDGWSSAPESKDGSALPNCTSWTRQVNVRYVNPSNPSGPGTTAAMDDEGLKRVVVTVTDPQGNQTTRVALRSKYSSYELPPPAGTTVIQWVGVELQKGPDPKARYRSAAHVMDRAPSG